MTACEPNKTIILYLTIVFMVFKKNDLFYFTKYPIVYKKMITFTHILNDTVPYKELYSNRIINFSKI